MKEFIEREKINNKMALEEAGIKLYAGVSGSADETVEALIAGTLDASGSAIYKSML